MRRRGRVPLAPSASSAAVEQEKEVQKLITDKTSSDQLKMNGMLSSSNFVRTFSFYLPRKGSLQFSRDSIKPQIANADHYPATSRSGLTCLRRKGTY